MKTPSVIVQQSFDYLPPDTARSSERMLLANIRRLMLSGFAVISLLVGGFFAWASSAPLAGGAVATGIISPEGSRRTVQHLEGGIIGDIKVRDGDVVTAGQPLLTLENTQARAAYEILLHQYWAATMLQARLTDEQLGRDTVHVPSELLDAGDVAGLQDIIAVQKHLFATRREALDTRKKVLRQKILQIQEQIAGFTAQKRSTENQLVVVNEELTAKETLLQKELVQKSMVLEVRRLRSQIEGQSGEYQAAIARARQQIGEAELELVSLDATRADDVANDLEKARGDLAKVTEQLNASADTLNRTEVRAPVAGTVVNMHFKTRGGVIGPGQAILDIVPDKENLLIDAHVPPVDIDVVHPGLSAKVQLTAYSKRSVPQILGTVRSVSADSLRDGENAPPYYLARVEVDRDQLAALGADIRLVPGMPAEVLIVTSERTLFGYLLQPVRDMFRRSLREV